MFWWILTAGALIGWASAGFEMYGFVLGVIFSVPMGLWFLRVHRLEIERAVADQLARFDFSAPLPEVPVSAIPEAAPDVTAATTMPLPRADTPPPHAIAEAPSAIPQAQSDGPDWHGPAAMLIGRARDWLLGGNTILRVGLVVLFLGLVFLARLVAQAGLFPIELRLATVAAAGAALLGVGYWKRLARPEFGLHLQGAGVAVLYLTVFAAARIYDVMPPGLAFAFMVVIAGFGAALAVLQNSQTLALASFAGGFAVPVLLGGSAETPLGLFGYITVLGAAIMGIAWKKSWRPLNLLGFFGTFALAGLWGFDAYQDRHFWICEVFLALNIGIYLGTALLYAHNTPGKLGNFADSTLLFGTAIAGFGLQAGLVHDKPYASAWSALVFGAAYLGVASWAFQRRKQGMALLSESLLAIGVGFVTMAIPLALELKWVSVAWALEGGAALWVGARQERWMPRTFGLGLQAFGAGIALNGTELNIAAIPFANPGFLEPLLIAAALVFSAWILREPLLHSGSAPARSWQRVEAFLGKPWFLAGFGMACVAVMEEMSRNVPAFGFDYGAGAYASRTQLFGFELGVLGLMALADWFGRRRDWAVASWPGRVSLLLIGWAFLATLFMGRYVLNMPDFSCWIAAFGLHYWMLWRADRAPDTAAPRWNGFIHACTVLVLTAMLADALFYLIDQADLWDSSWAGVVFMVAGTAVLLGIVRWAGPAVKAERSLTMGWPHNVHSRAYWWRAAAPLAITLWLGALFGTMLAEGITAPLPYIPLLNPVDLAIALALVALGLWRQMLQQADPMPRGAALFTGRIAQAAAALLAFVWINTIWTRTAHHYLGVEWYPDTLLQSQIVTTGFSILWTLLAMGLMLFAQRRADRLPWLAGAGLLALVVAKLLFVDMDRAEGIGRIVAFIGVGVLMLLIGYFVPLPPRKGQDAALHEGARP